MLALTLALAGALGRADEGPRARAQVNILDAKTYSGTVTTLGAAYRLPSKFDLGLNVDLLDRAYRGGATVNDTQFTAPISAPLSESVYLDAAASVASTANIYARWSASLAPHVVWEKTDFGLGVRYAEYRLTTVGVLSPSAMHYFASGLALGVGANVIRTDESIASGTLTAIYTPGAHHLVRVGGGYGRTLEDAGLTARFQVWSAEYAYTCTARVTLGIGFVDYASQVRQERTVLIRLGWR